MGEGDGGEMVGGLEVWIREALERNKLLFYGIFPKWPDPHLLLELLSHFFQKILTKNFKNNFFTVFSLLTHWHLFAFDCFRAKKNVT